MPHVQGRKIWTGRQIHKRTPGTPADQPLPQFRARQQKRRPAQGGVALRHSARLQALRQKAQPLQCGFRHVFPERTAEANPRERPALQPGLRQQAFQSQRKRGFDLEDFLHVGPGKLHAAGQRQAPASGPAFDGPEQAGGQR